MREKLKKIYRAIALGSPPVSMLIEFMTNVLYGYRIYANIKRKRGINCAIFATTMRGTGDYYLCGLLLRSLLYRDGINDYVFLCGGAAEYEAAELFPSMRGHLYRVRHKLVIPSDRFEVFVGSDTVNMRWMHVPSNTYAVCCKRTGNILLCGYRELDMLVWYKLQN